MFFSAIVLGVVVLYMIHSYYASSESTSLTSDGSTRDLTVGPGSIRVIYRLSRGGNAVEIR